MNRDPFRNRHNRPSHAGRTLRTMTGVTVAAGAIVAGTLALFSIGTPASPARAANVILPAVSAEAWAHDARQAGPQLPAHIRSWAELAAYCHTHSPGTCDVLPGAVRKQYPRRIGTRPARMIMSADGSTVFIVADYHGHVRIADES